MLDNIILLRPLCQDLLEVDINLKEFSAAVYEMICCRN